MDSQTDITISRRYLLQRCAGGILLPASSQIWAKDTTETTEFLGCSQCSGVNTNTTVSNENTTASNENATGNGEGSFISDVQTGTWLGLLGTLIGSFGILFLRWRRQQAKLRTALISELKHLDKLSEVDETLQSRYSEPLDEKISPSTVPPAGMFPTEVYKSNLGNIGMLQEETVDEIVSFYSSLIAHKSIMQSINAGEDLPMADHKELFENVSDQEERRKDLIEKLGGSPEEQTAE